jgi:predicted nuclease with TOPRIM domain
MTSVGADGKNREMTVLPLRFIFGWLFTIDSNLVKEESREAVVRYQLECYNALYNHFKSYVDFVDFRQEQIDEALVKYDEARADFSGAKNKLREARELLDEKRQINYQEFLNNARQTQLEFPTDRKTEDKNL